MQQVVEAEGEHAEGPVRLVALFLWARRGGKGEWWAVGDKVRRVDGGRMGWVMNSVGEWMRWVMESG